MSKKKQSEPKPTISNPSWLSNHGDHVLLHLYVQPGAKKDQIKGVQSLGSSRKERLKIQIHAPPVDGKANDHLLKFLSEIFQIPKSRLTLVRGATSKSKDILFDGISAEEISKILSPML